MVKKRIQKIMTEFCLFAPWALPVVTVVGSIGISALVGYGLWKFAVSPVKLENQQLRQFSEGLTQELRAARRREGFNLDAYIRQKKARKLIKAQYSVIRERLEALEIDEKSRAGSSSSAVHSKPEETSTLESVSLDTVTVTVEGPSCPLEGYDPAAIFDLFHWLLIIWWAILLLRSTREVWLCYFSRYRWGFGIKVISFPFVYIWVCAAFL